MVTTTLGTYLVSSRYVTKHAVATLAIGYRFFVFADEGAGATGLISSAVTASLCQFRPKKYGHRCQRLLDTLETFVPRVEQVISQTTQRVLQGETVSESEKVVSLFEPHTAIIRKGKAGKPTEFGRVLWVAETEGGSITQAQVLTGNPDDAVEVGPSLDRHVAQFTRPSRLLAGDGRLATPANEREAQQRGVCHVVLPRPGRKTAARVAYERQWWFRRGRTWRASMEGRISGLKRGHGLDRCRYHGDAGMQRWMGWRVMAHDLRVIAQHRAAQVTR